MPDQNPDPADMRRYIALAHTGVEMVAPIALGAWLDYLIGWGPWLTVAGAVLGFVGGMVHLILQSGRLEREESKRKQKKNGA